MDELVTLSEIPASKETYMIAGWRQWADAGAISSSLPNYLIDHLSAEKIGDIKPGAFYLFQMPSTHHLLRPVIKLVDGYRQELEPRQNEVFYSGDGEKGLAIFLGEEPHQNEARYAEAFLDIVEALGVKRVAAVAGVYGAMPYEKDREVSCVYSLPSMKADMQQYAVKLSNYEGGSTIGTYIADRAEPRGIEFLVYYAFVPMYDFAHLSVHFTGIKIEEDYKSWYDLMRRLDHMFSLHMDLSDLESRSEQLIASIDEQIDELEQTIPQLKVREYIRELTESFEERPFMPLGDVWERELGDLFRDLDE
jgi:proteasome assembly chaperone (PAC2) family protein